MLGNTATIPNAEAISTPCTDEFILNWFCTDWDNRKRIVIDHDMVNGDSNLDDFAVLVSVTDSDLTKARADCNDIIFTASDGITQIRHEIESCNQSIGELTAWIKLPELSPIDDTDFFIYSTYPKTLQYIIIDAR